MPEARSILEERLRANGGCSFGIWIDGRLAAVQALKRLSSQEGICEGTDRCTKLWLLVDLMAVSPAFINRFFPDDLKPTCWAETKFCGTNS